MTPKGKRTTLKITGIVLIIILGFGSIFFLEHYYQTNVLQSYKMSSPSMSPSLLVGDCIMADKSLQDIADIERGDIVVFAYPRDPQLDYVKRAIGLPGDILEIKDKEVFINGQRHAESYAVYSDERIFPASVNRRDNIGPVTVPDNALFVMGDNRDRSNDSRFWGFLKSDNLKGRVSLIYWSWNRDKPGVRWDRIGKSLR